LTSILFPGNRESMEAASMSCGQALRVWMWKSLRGQNQSSVIQAAIPIKSTARTKRVLLEVEYGNVKDTDNKYSMSLQFFPSVRSKYEGRP